MMLASDASNEAATATPASRAEGRNPRVNSKRCKATNAPNPASAENHIPAVSASNPPRLSAETISV